MSLKTRLRAGEVVLAPGVYDPLTALIATQHGFKALYVSGAAIAYTRLGRSDIGLTTMTEIAETIGLIRDRVDTPLIVDADNGHGNALNVQRTVRLYERAGANALQIEDQSLPKRCGHLGGKSLISCGEMVGKIKAAVDARASAETLIIARTDAIAVEGFDRALERAERFAEAGADVLFVEAPRTREQLETISSRLGARLPLLANMVEGGDTPMHDAGQLGALGFRIIIFPGGIVRAIAKTAVDYYASLKAHETNAPFKDRMFDFNGLNDIIGTRELLELGERYAAGDGGR
ncbi:isocitrate lyase/PEP mutase family protein [Parapusillimonas granuli]|uniref:Isocitrate lyase/PEP mutase family protein n=1 Tax=Parapusillimonas granuli TaxID=380911 RepID=A0A853FRB6_9BURK|nr:isocitrate lyase/PEP mutase family protein [Parapusillimonas granuli]MBB5213497.1 2-methylisocitrate lyase-like PEP mutase family enzyme [Parapusillimonas granuli]MEB2398590.1 isocitrate lyase/PEP mutase family protein [Alcaligenaceae bacterium]NYT48335.1 isocitrate lyase/PEP mutase family protein [Parapusillimonas granuli]